MRKAELVWYLGTTGAPNCKSQLHVQLGALTADTGAPHIY